MAEGIGERFQRETKYERGSLPGGWLDLSTRPSPYKEYDDVDTVALPDPAASAPGAALAEVMGSRRSVRDFAERPLTLGEVSFLLWASAGVSGRAGDLGLRTAPSAGALYPVDTYLVVNRVEDLHPGVYHYRVRGHVLEQLRKGDLSREVAEAALDQTMCADAPVVFVWTAVFARAVWKYRQRAYRYVYLDAGHVAAHLSLAACGLGLGSCQIAALYDGEVNELLGVDGVEESALYMSVVGEPAR